MQGTDSYGRTPAQALVKALDRLKALLQTHPQREAIAARLWVYDLDEDLSAAAGFEVNDQTLGDVLHDLLRRDDNPYSVLEERGLLDDLEVA